MRLKNIKLKLILWSMFFIFPNFSFAFLDFLIPSSPNVKIVFDDKGTTVTGLSPEGNGDLLIEGTYSNQKQSNKVSSVADPQKSGYTANFKIVSGVQDRGSKHKLSVDPFPFISDGHIIGGITKISQDDSIYATALHLFKNEWSNREEALNSVLKNKLPLLIKNFESDNSYFDIVLFYDSSFIQSAKNIDVLKTIIMNKLNLNHVKLIPGMNWISPSQVGRQAQDAALQNSHGEVSKVVTRRNSNSSYSFSFTEFYLAASEFNFSSKGSSGSIIFDAKAHKSLGLLQCQMNKNLIFDGAVQNTKGLYKILSFDVLKHHEIVQLGNLLGEDSLRQLNQIADELREDEDCNWRCGGKLCDGP